jgi:hypothetical protein
MKFLNGGGSWNEHFSYDEQGLLSIYLFATVLYFLVSIPVGVLVARLWARKLFNPVLRILSSAYCMELLSCMFLLIHYAQYKEDGIGIGSMHQLGKYLHVLQSLLFMLALLLISKGWTISTLKLNKKRVLAIMYTMYVALYATLFVWDDIRDKATVVYVYESAPGIGLIVLNLLVMLYFIVQLCRCHAFERRSKAKRRFYRVVGWVFSFWFLVLPVVVGVAAVADPWIRRKVVECLNVLFTFLGYGVMPFLGKPSNAYEIYSQDGDLTSEKIPTIKQMGRIQPAPAYQPAQLPMIQAQSYELHHPQQMKQHDTLDGEAIALDFQSFGDGGGGGGNVGGRGY